MGVFKLLLPFWLSLLILLITSPYSILATTSGGGSMGDDILSSTPPPPSPPPPPVAPFKPSIAVIVGVLTTMFSLTFLVLLYAKHCKRGNGYANGTSNSRGPVPTVDRKNSGVGRTVIESLPIFRFNSLRGLKDGLECAVCLNRFEPIEVLRLLPKCKHAFHVECVDTWLDAHSTCPLCRYRVDPEDILLVEDNKILNETDHPPPPPEQDPKEMEFRRVSGRHSSAGERGIGSLQIVIQRPDESEIHDATSFTTRRSLDSSNTKRKISSESVSIGCFDKIRKDGLLLNEATVVNRTSFERRFEHRIIVSGTGFSDGVHHRWSDVQPTDLLYLRSEKIINDSRRFSGASGSRPSVSKNRDQNTVGGGGVVDDDRVQQSGRSVINARSVSEITGLSRFVNRGCSNEQRQRNEQAGLVSRWLAWISQSRPAVHSGRPSIVVV